MNPCRRYTTPGDVVGTPCHSCGHTDLVHPGAHNPMVTECVVCTLLANVAAYQMKPAEEPKSVIYVCNKAVYIDDRRYNCEREEIEPDSQHEWHEVGLDLYTRAAPLKISWRSK